MSFLYPQFLFALSALLVPVIIHLFNFRRYKKIFFTNVSLLKDIETSSKSVKQLKNLLVLLTRLLGLAFLVLAFAQPIIPLSQNSAGSTTNQVIIFVDNSQSMGVFTGGKSWLELAKLAAGEVIEKKGRKASFHILTNDFMQSEMNELGRDDAISSVNLISVTPRRRTLNEIVNRIKAISDQQANGLTECYFVSDFQRNQLDLAEVNPDTALFFNFVKIGNQSFSNLSIDSCWMVNFRASFQGRDSLTVRIRNLGSEDLEKQRLRLYVNDKQVWIGSIDLSKQDKKDVTIPLDHQTFGTYNCRIELSDNTLDFDNQLFFSYQIDSSTTVYYIGPDKYSPPFEAVFTEPFRYSKDLETNIDISVLNSSSCIIYSGSGNLSSGLTDVINKRVSEGASLILIPADSSLSGNFNDLLSRLSAGQFQAFDTALSGISSVNISSDLLNSVIRKLPDNPNLPWARGHFVLKPSSRSAVEDILLFDNGPALRRIPYENGNIFLFCFDLSESRSNMVRHSLFVPIMINAAFSGNRKYSLYNILGHDELVDVDYPSGTDEVFHLKGKDMDIIPEIRRGLNGTQLQFDQQVRFPGNYEIRLSNEFVRNVSFNYGREESNLDCYEREEIEDVLSEHGELNARLYSGEFTEVISSLGKSASHVALWKYCIILALMFFIGEALILKLIKS